MILNPAESAPGGRYESHTSFVFISSRSSEQNSRIWNSPLVSMKLFPFSMGSSHFQSNISFNSKFGRGSLPVFGRCKLTSPLKSKLRNDKTHSAESDSC